jgi:hypothetical protein
MILLMVIYESRSMSDEMITIEELAGLFGTTMPMEAVRMIFEDDLSLRGLREKLHVLASSQKYLDQLLCNLLMAETPEEQMSIRKFITESYQKIP